MKKHTFVLMAILAATIPGAALGQSDPSPQGVGLRLVDRKPRVQLQGVQPAWIGSLAAAQKIASRKDRPILLYFTATW